MVETDSRLQTPVTDNRHWLVAPTTDSVFDQGKATKQVLAAVTCLAVVVQQLCQGYMRGTVRI